MYRLLLGIWIMTCVLYLRNCDINVSIQIVTYKQIIKSYQFVLLAIKVPLLGAYLSLLHAVTESIFNIIHAWMIQYVVTKSILVQYRRECLVETQLDYRYKSLCWVGWILSSVGLIRWSCLVYDIKKYCWLPCWWFKLFSIVLLGNNTLLIILVLMFGMLLQVNAVELESVLTKGAYMLLYARYHINYQLLLSPIPQF